MSKIVDIATVHFQCSESGNTYDPEAVCQQFSEAAERLDGTGVDLVVTCEGMSSRGQLVEEAESNEAPGRMLRMYLDFSKRNACVVAGSVKFRENGNIYNAIVFTGPEGTILGTYRKMFLTPGELNRGLTPGEKNQLIDTSAGKLAGAICYDVNFDEHRDSCAALHPDILCFSSMCAGGMLLNNWAYKTRSFVASSCKDDVSRIIDPLGRTLSSTSFYNRIAWARINLDRFVMHWDKNIAKFRDIRAKYQKRVLIDVEPSLCSAVLYSCTPEISAAEIATEFDLVSLDDYLKQSLKLLRA